jgi:hypothetical protein
MSDRPTDARAYPLKSAFLRSNRRVDQGSSRSTLRRRRNAGRNASGTQPRVSRSTPAGGTQRCVPLFALVTPRFWGGTQIGQRGRGFLPLGPLARRQSVTDPGDHGRPIGTEARPGSVTHRAARRCSVAFATSKTATANRDALDGRPPCRPCSTTSPGRNVRHEVQPHIQRRMLRRTRGFRQSGASTPPHASTHADAPQEHDVTGGRFLPPVSLQGNTSPKEDPWSA